MTDESTKEPRSRAAVGRLLKLQLQLRPAWLDVLVHIRLCVARLGLSRGHRRVWPALLMT
jgi:hypothetical protein